MPKRSLALLLAALFFCRPTGAADPAPSGNAPDPVRSYAILASHDTLAEPAWRRAVDALEKKYQGRVFPYDPPDLEATQDAVAAYAPRYLCVVARPADATRGLVKQVARFVRTLDDDPYEDAIWAILTGYDADDALRIASAAPLEVARGISHVGGGWLDLLEAGVSWSEGTKNQKFVKAKGEKVQTVAGPDDTTREIAAELGRGIYDVMSSSGHATEHDWQLGYSYPNGMFVSRAGRLVAVDTHRKGVELRSPNPKVYYSPGNCLIAHVSDADCMLLAWIHSGGANQFFGHVVPQYRTCWAWDVAHYFFALQGRFSFAESVFLFHQDVIARLAGAAPADAEARFFLTSDRDATVLYGDPAWQARVRPCVAPPYDQTLTWTDAGDGQVELQFTVKALSECAPGEPAAVLLPARIGDAAVVRTDAAQAVVADDFVLLRLVKPGEKALQPGETRGATIRARKAAGLARSGRPAAAVERAAACTLGDLAPASAGRGPIMDVERAPGSGPRPPAEADDGRGRWQVAGEAVVHAGADGKEDARLALLGRHVTCCAWDGKYLWLAEKGLLSVVTDGCEVLFSIPVPEAVDPVALAVDAETVRIREGNGGEVRGRLDRSLAVTLGPKRRALLDFTAEVADVGAAGMDLVDLFVAAPWDTNRQQVVGEIALAAPARVTTDRWGQRCFAFSGVGIPPGRPFGASIAWNADLADARWWVWPERTGGRDAVPAAIAKQYLVDSPILGVATPEIRAAAAEAIGRETEPFWIARAVHRYVIAHLRFERGNAWADAPTILKRGTGTCSSFTYLFLALCRAAGVPARFAAGTRCRAGVPSTDSEFHRWAEVYLPGYGWVPADPSSGGSGDAFARAAAFGHVPDTDFVLTVGGGDSECLDWQYNAHARVDTEAELKPQIGERMQAVWSEPGLAPPAAEPPRDGLANGDFDGGTFAGWRVEGPHLTLLSTATRTGKGTCLQIKVGAGASCEGDVAAHADRWERTWRKVWVPEEAGVLRFRTRVTGAAWHEPVRVFIDRGDGPKVVCAAGAADGTGKALEWTEEVVDVTPLRGMTVLVGFFGANGNGNADHATEIFVDDVALFERRAAVGEPEPRQVDVPAGAVPAPGPAVRARIAALLARLAAESGAGRQEAAEALVALGAPARAQVEAAARAEDPALRLHALRVVTRLDELDFRLTEEERAANAARGKQ